MKVLVFGNSDTSGEISGGTTWTGRLRESLSREIGESAQVEEISFFPIASSAPDYAERKARAVDADVVILPLGTFAFLTGFVWVRVERLFGKRVAGWYKRVEWQFDSRTRSAGRTGRSLNSVARKVTRLVVGTQPLATLDETTTGYGNVLRALARLERAQVVLVGYPGQGRYVRGSKGRQWRKFTKEMKAVADEHHYAFVEPTAQFEQRAPGGAGLTPDEFHMSELGHEILGGMVFEAVIAAESRAAPASG